MKLHRPLAVFDLETTGINPAEDRIVEVALVRLQPDGSRDTQSWLVNPGRPIPQGAIAVHGISDADVADAPSFEDLAPEIQAAFEGCDLSGFHAERFDIPLLAAEFRRVGMTFPAPDTRIIDSRAIFVAQEPRTLAAAVSFYLGRSHDGAHRAEADAVAAADVLMAQIARYDDLPSDIDALHEHLHPTDPSWIDSEGKIAWQGSEPVLTFGKHRERPLRELVAEQCDYLRWVISKDFPEDTKAILAAAIEGRYPSPR
jgi:DNA polymerase-3 subunit epsilon